LKTEKPIFDLEERCVQFSLQVFKLIEPLKETKVPYPLIDQLTRSSSSIGANIVEGKSSSSDKEFCRYYRIALKSANETKYWLRLITEGFNYPDKNKLNALLTEAKELSNIIASIIIKIKNKTK
jgi:four helix bundle protein